MQFPPIPSRFWLLDSHKFKIVHCILTLAKYNVHQLIILIKTSCNRISCIISFYGYARCEGGGVGYSTWVGGRGHTFSQILWGANSNPGWCMDTLMSAVTPEWRRTPPRVQMFHCGFIGISTASSLYHYVMIRQSEELGRHCIRASNHDINRETMPFGRPCILTDKNSVLGEWTHTRRYYIARNVNAAPEGLVGKL